jgi:hypothetical protein
MKPIMGFKMRTYWQRWGIYLCVFLGFIELELSTRSGSSKLSSQRLFAFLSPWIIIALAL